MAKKDEALSVIPSKGKEVVFYAYKKSHTFSLPAFEVDDNDSSKFKLDKNGDRIPLYEIPDPEKNIKRRVRKPFAFTLMPNITKETPNGKSVEYKCVFVPSRDKLYCKDLIEYLTAESKKEESVIWSDSDFNKNEHPEAFAVAEKVSAQLSEYEKQITDLKAENERLKKGN